MISVSFSDKNIWGCALPLVNLNEAWFCHWISQHRLLKPVRFITWLCIFFFWFAAVELLVLKICVLSFMNNVDKLA